jgi:uncharacterized protein
MRLLKFAILAVLFAGCTAAHKNTNPMQAYALRLKPGEDVKQAIDAWVAQENIQAGYIATAVGSLTDYNIRFANRETGDSATGHFEIVSLVGTISVNGSHLHISVADSTGRTLGGHLLAGNKVYTTLELVLVETKDFVFSRENDGSTPWKELIIRKIE